MWVSEGGRGVGGGVVHAGGGVVHEAPIVEVPLSPLGWREPETERRGKNVGRGARVGKLHADNP